MAIPAFKNEPSSSRVNKRIRLKPHDASVAEAKEEATLRAASGTVRRDGLAACVI